MTDKNGHLLYEGVIYKYTNKINGKIYIGQTTDEKGRISSHKNSKDFDYFHCAIRKYGFDNFEYKVLFRIYCLSKQDLRNTLNIKEELIIRLLNSTNPSIGYNMQKGGSFFITSNKSNSDKIVQLDLFGDVINIWDSVTDAKNNTGLTRSAIRDGLKNIDHVSKGYLWYTEKEYKNIIKEVGFISEVVSTGCNKAVVQLSLEGKFIKVWSSIKNIGEELGIGTSWIHKSAKDFTGAITSGDYLWYYLEDYELIKENKHFISSIEKPVIQFSASGEFIKEWKSATEAGRSLGIKNDGITACCKRTNTKEHGVIRNRILCGGFRWMYKSEYDSGMEFTKSNEISRNIVQLTLEGEYVKEWKSINQAAIYLRSIGLTNSKKSSYKIDKK